MMHQEVRNITAEPHAPLACRFGCKNGPTETASPLELGSAQLLSAESSSANRTPCQYMQTHLTLQHSSTPSKQCHVLVKQTTTQSSKSYIQQPTTISLRLSAGREHSLLKARNFQSLHLLRSFNHVKMHQKPVLAMLSIKPTPTTTPA